MASSHTQPDHSSHAPKPSPSFNYPFAAAPDIIRSNQKDIYFQGVLHEQLSSIIRRLYGIRTANKIDSEARTFTELLYLGLTTFIGNRTLGEEYCDILHISDDTLRLPPISRRASYILSVVLLPYALTKLLPAFRTRLRRKLEANLRQQQPKDAASNRDAFSSRLQSYLLTHLSTITSPSPIHALTLALFYFTGSYYHLSKRLSGLRYIFTKRIPPSEQRVGYEVLGVLLVLQMAVQGWLHLHSTFRPPEQATIPDAGSLATGGSAMLDDGVEVSTSAGRLYTSNNDLLLQSSAPAHHDVKRRIEKMTHTPVLEAEQARYDLKEPETMAWIAGERQRKCTLCLEEMRDPSVTTCGHVFCWTCIAGWIREKPECPLCRQSVMAQHVLTLRG
ncbi:MAG: peroxisome bioproteinsis factor 10 [Heterodermia speciosa]|uniref:RING-type E3 ubiquitin transferase n=1 Tax=Heterodermia speciosa TaxID=116794 RepID=A0A8H3FJ72_9LECA|nr:MAG: peroxisome bioproteinsis factor 10 [Heterodermia speciosa]